MKITLQTDSQGLPERISRAGDGWLDSLEKMPPLPDSLLPMVNNYTEGQPVSQDIKVIPISGQIWSRLTMDEREQLLELVEYTGVRAEDYCRLWQSMLTRDPVRRR